MRKDGRPWKEELEDEREERQAQESQYSHREKISSQKSLETVRGYITEQAPKLKKKKMKKERKVKIKKRGRKVGRKLGKVPVRKK